MIVEISIALNPPVKKTRREAPLIISQPSKISDASHRSVTMVGLCPTYKFIALFAMSNYRRSRVPGGAYFFTVIPASGIGYITRFAVQQVGGATILKY
jgi:hypothetical protein